MACHINDLMFFKVETKGFVINIVRKCYLSIYDT